MLMLSADILLQWVAEFFLPFFRIAAFFAVVPVFGNQLLPMLVRLSFALAVSILLIPLLPAIDTSLFAKGDNIFSFALVVVVVQQIIIGSALGFFVQLFFHIFVLAGQMVGMQMGLGFASMIDPTNGVSVTVLSQFNVVLSTLLFLAFNGHLILVQVIIESFTFLPVGQALSQSALQTVYNGGVWMFASAFLLALPAVAAILIVNLAFGVMTRAAPQLNIFSLGFPFTLVFGLFILWVVLASFLPQYQTFSEQTFQALHALLNP